MFGIVIDYVTQLWWCRLMCRQTSLMGGVIRVFVEPESFEFSNAWHCWKEGSLRLQQQLLQIAEIINPALKLVEWKQLEAELNKFKWHKGFREYVELWNSIDESEREGAKGLAWLWERA